MAASSEALSCLVYVGFKPILDLVDINNVSPKSIRRGYRELFQMAINDQNENDINSPITLVKRSIAISYMIESKVIEEFDFLFKDSFAPKDPMKVHLLYRKFLHAMNHSFYVENYKGLARIALSIALIGEVSARNCRADQLQMYFSLERERFIMHPL